jgi:inner membrane protein
MASIGHVAVGLAAARAYAGPEERPSWLAMVFWPALALLPDIDVVGFMGGVPYGAAWGHRGATHSLLLAAAGGVATGLAARIFKRPVGLTTAVAVVVLASHGLLDTMTDGGLGIALLWPFSLTRFFAPWQPIPVAPIGPAFLTLDGATVALSEIALFLPLWLFAFRFRVRMSAVALWLVLVWLIGSSDPVRERVLSLVLRDDTRFAPGYSEQAFRAIVVGDAEDAVRGRLGEPVFESLFYLPKGTGFRSIMEMSAAKMPSGCFGAGVKDGVVHDVHDAAVCKSQGVGEGISKRELVRILGAPSASCAEYSESPGHGHARLRMVCFVNGKVEVVFRRWV